MSTAEKLTPGWVSSIAKAQLETYVREFGMEPEVLAEDLRRQLSEFIENGDHDEERTNRLRELSQRHSRSLSPNPGAGLNLDITRDEKPETKKHGIKNHSIGLVINPFTPKEDKQADEEAGSLPATTKKRAHTPKPIPEIQRAATVHQRDPQVEIEPSNKEVTLETLKPTKREFLCDKQTEQIPWRKPQLIREWEEQQEDCLELHPEETWDEDDTQPANQPAQEPKVTLPKEIQEEFERKMAKLTQGHRINMKRTIGDTTYVVKVNRSGAISIMKTDAASQIQKY